MAATRKSKPKDKPVPDEMPMQDFDQVMKALMKVPPKHRATKQPTKKKSGA
jgi:hypothetical protein